MNRRAIVLSGGGARGAYEAGVISVVLERAAKRPGPWVDFVCGTSVGAITGAHLAANIDQPSEASRELLRFWSELSIEDVLAFGADQLRALPRLVFGGNKSAGLFDGRTLTRLVDRHLRWAGIGEHVASGRLKALTITATHVPSGYATMFVQRGPDVPRPGNGRRRTLVRDATIGAAHVLASAAIPVFFPPVRVDGDLYCDGGLTSNTPLGPAIRLGANKVLAISLSATRREPGVAANRYPSASFLLGKLLNTFLLDRVTNDLDELDRINQFMKDGAAVSGPDFETRMAAVAVERGKRPYHTVEAVVVRPSVDLGEIAADQLRRMRRRLGRVSVARGLVQFLDATDGEGSDLASYLLFDRAYAADLIALGRVDALVSVDAIDAFILDERAP